MFSSLRSLPVILWRHGSKETLATANNNIAALAFSTNVGRHQNADDNVEIYYRGDLPVMNVPLPSRKELCQFILKPTSNSLQDFINDLMLEDKGIDSISAYTLDGLKISRSTQISHLLSSDFKLLINDESYLVQPPRLDGANEETINQVDNVKTLVYQLYTSMNVENHQLCKEQKLLGELDDLKKEMLPLDEARIFLEERADKRTNFMVWAGLAYMSIQFGVFARLTWWEYSWDIMEPVTYFATYGTALACYGYYTVTKTDYTYPDVRDRLYLITFYKGAEKHQFNVTRYNNLKDKIAKVESDLRRLRDPLTLSLPILPPEQSQVTTV